VQELPNPHYFSLRTYFHDRRIILGTRVGQASSRWPVRCDHEALGPRTCQPHSAYSLWTIYLSGLIPCSSSLSSLSLSLLSVQRLSSPGLKLQKPCITSVLYGYTAGDARNLLLDLRLGWPIMLHTNQPPKCNRRLSGQGRAIKGHESPSSRLVPHRPHRSVARRCCSQWQHASQSSPSTLFITAAAPRQ
jgi:hypothetical protein